MSDINNDETHKSLLHDRDLIIINVSRSIMLYLSHLGLSTIIHKCQNYSKSGIIQCLSLFRKSHLSIRVDTIAFLIVKMARKNIFGRC